MLVIPQQCEYVLVPVLLRPGLWTRPRLGVWFDGIGTAFQKQLRDFYPAPTACPAKRGAVEQAVAMIGSRARIQQGSCEGETLLRGYMRARSGDAVKNGQVEAVARASGD